MRRRFLAAAALASALVGTVATSDRLPAPGPLGDEASDLLQVASLAGDHDLRFDASDLDRAYGFWASGPRGVALVSTDGGATRALSRPLAFTLAAWPLYAVFGARGVLLLQAGLFVGLAAFAWRLRGFAGDAGGLYALGFVAGSAALGGVTRFGSHLFELACVLGALGLWWRERGAGDAGGAARLRGWVAVGLLLGAAVVQEPLALVAVAALVVDLAAGPWRRAIAMLAAGLALWGAVALLDRALHRGFEVGAETRVFYEPEALDRGTEGWQDGVRTDGLRALHALERRPATVLRNAGYLLVGRHVGWLPLYPFAAVALASFLFGARDRVRWLLAGAFTVGFVLLAVERADAWSAPLFDLGYQRWAVLAPLLFFLPAGLVRRRWLMLGAIAAGIWTAPAALARWGRDGRAAATSLARQALPLELTLLGARRLDDYAVRVVGDRLWALPRASAYVEEPRVRGVWLAGESRSEVVVIGHAPAARVAFRVFAFAPSSVVRVASGGEDAVVRFDSEAKRAQGVPIDLPARTVAADLGGFFPEAEAYARLTLDVRGGGVPHRSWRKNPDPRYLGAYVSFDGAPP